MSHSFEHLLFLFIRLLGNKQILTNQHRCCFVSGEDSPQSDTGGLLDS